MLAEGGTGGARGTAFRESRGWDEPGRIDDTLGSSSFSRRVAGVAVTTMSHVLWSMDGD